MILFYRYDCRGALSDLSKYEASREGFDVMRWLGLSDKERQLEELCDKERYYSLEMNEEEEEMYKGISILVTFYVKKYDFVQGDTQTLNLQ